MKAKIYLEDLGLQDWKIEHQTEEGQPITIWISELMEDYYLECPSCPNCGGKALL